MGNNILVVTEGRDGTLRKVSYELVTVANEIAKGLGGAVQVVVLGNNVGPCAELMSKTGVGQVYHADSPAMEHFAPEVFATVLAGVIKQTQPAVILFGATG